MKKLILCLIMFSFACKKEAKNNVQPITPPPQTWQSPNPGIIMFYVRDSCYSALSPNAGKSVNIFIDGTFLKETSMVWTKFDGKPTCGNPYAVNYYDTIFNAHTYYAKQAYSPFKTWNGSFKLKEDTCIVIDFFTHD